MREDEERQEGDEEEREGDEEAEGSEMKSKARDRNGNKVGRLPGKDREEGDQATERKDMKTKCWGMKRGISHMQRQAGRIGRHTGGR